MNIYDNHTHTFINDVCELCCLHKEEIFTTLSGVFEYEQQEEILCFEENEDTEII